MQSKTRCGCGLTLMLLFVAAILFAALIVMLKERRDERLERVVDCTEMQQDCKETR